ncbi:hypothetical protein BKA56DRAFT_69877 [Ilyonectria sp. MPI-CAGE-AT-0026]|nr:hypothetical protein BKA56DRAFT_69877 [Ilyonectria sp. MPI-CAGE-AT-0026]
MAEGTSPKSAVGSPPKSGSGSPAPATSSPPLVPGAQLQADDEQEQYDSAYEESEASGSRFSSLNSSILNYK